MEPSFQRLHRDSHEADAEDHEGGALQFDNNTYTQPSSSQVFEEFTVVDPVEDNANVSPGGIRPLGAIRRWAGRLFGRARYSSIRGGGITDGVFGNLVAKEDARQAALGHSTHDDDGLNGGILISNEDDTPAEHPPTYNEAAADNSPSYWETTMSAFEWADDVVVDGLLVGSFLHFGWNALIATAFGEVGFALTYLFHSTHAAKSGSFLGFGITLIQLTLAFDDRNRAPPVDIDSMFYPDNPTGFDGGSISGVLIRTTQPGQLITTTSRFLGKQLASIVAYVVAGLFILGAIYGFWRADRKRRALLRRVHETEAEGVTVEGEPESLYQTPDSSGSHTDMNRSPV